tara:strand:+ start:77 stop:211 length:135 start_codon:yes stop_codon:yes gene_type:complete
MPVDEIKEEKTGYVHGYSEWVDLKIDNTRSKMTHLTPKKKKRKK